MSTLSVSNIPEDCTDDELHALFDRFGRISLIDRCRPRSGAWIEFCEPLDRSFGYSTLNGLTLRGNILNVTHMTCIFARLSDDEEEDEMESPDEVVARERLATAAEERLAAAASEDAWAVAVAPPNDAMRVSFDRAAAVAWTRADESELSPRVKKILHEIDSVLVEAVDAGNTPEGVYLQVANLLKKAYENDHEESFRAHFRQLLEDDGIRIVDDDGPSNT